MNVPLWIAVPVVALTAVAVRADVRTRKIPNRLTGPAVLLAIVAHVSLEGLTSTDHHLISLFIKKGRGEPQLTR